MMIVSTPLLGSSIICYCFSILLLLHFPCADGFQTATLSAISISSSSSSALQAFKWPTIPTFNEQRTVNTIGERNGLDSDYPWRFEGRFIFRPSLVKVSYNNQPPSSATLLSLFGYSLGGSVVLEYDISPVGPYREYVTMGGVVGLGNVNVGTDDNGIQKRLLGGQWGTNLYVSTQVAEDVCKVVWGVPAQVAEIEFIESGDILSDGPDDNKGNRKLFKLSGWGNNARILKSDDDATPPKRFGNIPIYWTPTIKALWAPLLFPGGGNEREELLPLHKLRLSVSAISLKRCQRIIDESTNQQEGEIPLGLALVVDNVLIEIGERITSG